jgi:para-aminobenzoate synthetase component 1
VRARIARGDLFQANVSQRFDGRLEGSPLALFRRLAAASPTPFLGYHDLGGGRFVLSASPERFLARRGDRVETRPMKGTRPRGRTAGEDRALARALRESEKERAELAMIVDLSRNDLARVCRAGTVRVETARRLERWATVHQATATVSGRLRADASGADLLRACFPPGSVTGAPKVEAMCAIDALEGEARGPYCGAVGWLDAGGDLDLAVAIRTVCTAGRRVTWRVGGGVTWPSEPAAEHAETLAKGRAISAAVAGAGTES